jgi:hypothetical protein
VSLSLGFRCAQCALLFFVLAVGGCTRRSSPGAQADFVRTGPSTAVPPSDASASGTMLDCIVAIAKQGRNGALTPSQAARLCGGSVVESEIPTSWEIRTSFPDLTVVANQSGGPEHPAAEYDLTVRAEADLTLAHLAAMLGAYRKTFESKTSAVLFEGSKTDGRIFADLLSSKVDPRARVIRVVVRSPAAHVPSNR